MNLFTPRVKEKRQKISVAELTVFSMLGTVMFCSKIIMEALPNIHLLGMLVMVYTLVYRKKALIPIYIYVFLNGIYAGFSLWWVPYLYVWTVLWAATMLLPQNMSKRTAAVVYSVVCALHGLSFGMLYAPAQAVMFSLSFKQMLAWIAAGFSFDCVHAIGNFAAGFLIIPLVNLLKRLDRFKRIK